MEQAFEMILNSLSEVLLEQGFSAPKEFSDEVGKGYIYSTEDLAYSVVYDAKKQLFLLRSNSYDADGRFANDWKVLSEWLFDKEEGTSSDAASIGRDFVEVVMGPRRIAAVQSAKKKSKKKGDDDNNIDPIFFFNRLVSVFPELKDIMNEHRIKYGKIKVAHVAKEWLAPRIEDLALNHPNSDSFKRVSTLINDMYKDGDPDLRAIITAGILNSIDSSEAITKIGEGFGDELKKVYKCSRKLKGKDIKPEKVKKQSKVVAAALNNANK